MPTHQPIPNAPRRSARVRCAVALVVAAMGLSTYLLGVSLSGGAAAGCGPDSPCHDVLSSRWSQWFGVPVSALALGVYAGLLAALGIARSAPSEVQRRAALAALIMLATMVAGAALWFVAAQVWLIGAVCPYCLAAHTCGIVSIVLLLPDISSPAGSTPARSRRTQAVLAGLAAVGVLIAGQAWYEPPTYRVASLPESSAVRAVPAPSPTNAPPASTPSAVTGPATSPLPAPPRLLALHGGQFELDLREVPVLGSPDAPHTVVCLFDYTCSHCRTLHRQLAEVLGTLSNQLAVACVVVPLDTNCNPIVRRMDPASVHACDYARLSLAVWRADREQFRAFDTWLFEGDAPPSPEAARERAEALVGLDAVPSALADPWVEDQIRRNIALYLKNYEVTRRSRLPQLMFGSQVSEGRMRSAAELAQLLGAQLGSNRPAPQAPTPVTPN